MKRNVVIAVVGATLLFGIVVQVWGGGCMTSRDKTNNPTEQNFCSGGPPHFCVRIVRAKADEECFGPAQATDCTMSSGNTTCTMQTSPCSDGACSGPWVDDPETDPNPYPCTYFKAIVVSGCAG